MNKEIRDIIGAYHLAVKENKRTALATVVKVEGSSYRRPGARMLVTENGQLTGAISGGCLEGDALRKALLAITQQENKLVTYDTTDEDDAKFGVQLGCNGIVYILFEPIKPQDSTNPITLLTALAAKREHAVMATSFSLHTRTQPGTVLLYRKNDCLALVDVSNEIKHSAATVIQSGVSRFEDKTINSEPYTCFLEFIQPSISLVIAGAGNDAQPLAEIAWLLGWEVTIVDGRPNQATSQRFPKATSIQVLKAGEVLEHVTMDEQTAFVLMTHNYNYDRELLKDLLKTDAPYIGTLGPKTKLCRMLDELGVHNKENEERVHGPVGIDIGAETAEEIAISVIAEIKAFFMRASGRSLKHKKTPIHHSGNIPGNTGIVILAAGNSTRMGKPKQTLVYNGKTLLERIIDTALTSSLRPIVVVLGAHAEVIPQQSDAVVYQINPDWQSGLSSSIATGLSVMLKDQPSIENVIFAVADQVFITPDIFETLVTARQQTGKNIIACSYAKTRGTPVLFNKKYFSELLALEGDQGAKPVLKLYPDDIETVSFEPGSVDIDTEADYLNLITRG